jgi:hypothetical protein
MDRATAKLLLKMINRYVMSAMTDGKKVREMYPAKRQRISKRDMSTSISIESAHNTLEIPIVSHNN